MILIYGVSGVSFSFYAALMERYFVKILLPPGNGMALFLSLWHVWNVCLVRHRVAASSIAFVAFM